MLGHFDQVTSLQAAGQTTREAIRRALQELASSNLGSRDTVVVYISSHGTLARDRRGELRRYLVTTDTRLDDVAGTALSVEELRNTFASFRSERKVLLLATCHSGEGKSGLPVTVATELRGIKGAFFVPPLESVSRASVIIGVCAFGETAREDERLGHDIYTYFLLEAMQLGDRNGDGAVTVTEAHEHARSRTYYFTQGRQRAYLESDILGDDPIVLSGRIVRPGRPELFAFAPALEGVTVLVDGQEKGGLPGAFTVEAGRHTVELRRGDAGVFAQQELQLGVGQRIDLATLPPLDQEGPLAPRFRVGPRLGYGLPLLASGVAAEQLASSFQGGVGAGLRLTRRLELALSAALSRTTHAAPLRSRSGAETRVAFDYREVGLGLGLNGLWTLGPVQLRVGPHAQLSWLDRSLDIAGLQRDEAGWLFGPGLAAGVARRLGEALSLVVELQSHYTLVQVDGNRQGLVQGEALLGLDWEL